MMLSPFPVIAGLLFSLQTSLAADPSRVSGQTIPLSRRQHPKRTVEDWGAWAKNEREALQLKYGGSPPSKRNEGTNLMINQNADASYIGSLAIGTPPVAFYVILDTGSADLWVTDINCVQGCDSGSTPYNPSSSSTFNNLSQSFSITYGSGQAAGYLASDIVQMAGFSVNNQSFGSATAVSQGVVDSPVSGLMGLGWQSIASSGTFPFWQTLARQGAWSEPVMGFQLTRFLNDSNAKSLEPGGSFTMGFVNSSLYTGNIDYRNLATSPGFWILPLTQLTVQGSNISLPSGSGSYAAIDTGTTLVGGPSSVIQNFYAQIPGSQPGTGNWDGYWTYPCNTDVNVAVSFGGPSWPISPNDFKLTQIGSNTCVGAFFEPNLGNIKDAPTWIMGDTFLKNVYSVFRYSPPSVGFAALSGTALAMNGVNGPPPTATIGSAQTTVTATSGNTTTSGAMWTSGSTFSPLWVVTCGMIVGTLIL